MKSIMGGSLAWCAMVACLVTLSAPAYAQVTPLKETFAYNQGDPFMGRWLGTTSRGNNTPLDLSIYLERDGARKPQMWVDLGQANIYFMLAGNIVIDEVVEGDVKRQRIAFSLPPTPKGGVFRITATLSDDGQELRGKMVHTPRNRDAPDVPVILRRVPRTIDLPEQYMFSGITDHPSAPFEFNLMLARTPGGNWVGHYDNPVNSGYNIPAYNIVIDKDGTFECQIADSPPWLLEGTIDAQMNVIQGKWLRGQAEFPFKYERQELVRHEIRYYNLEGTMLAGTLTYPPTPAPERGFPVAMICSTFGPQTREGELGDQAVYARIADELARAGIASFKIDDRGVGRALGTYEGVTTADTARDIASALIALAKTPRIDPDRIGLIGHGDGALAAVMGAGVKVKPAFIATFSMPTLSGFEQFTKRVEANGQVLGKTQDQILADVQFDRGLVKMLIEDKTSEQVAKAVENELKKQRAALEPAAAAALPAIDAEKAALLAKYDTPWVRGFVKIDPQPMLATVQVPFFAAYASRDYPVPGVPNRERALEAFAPLGDLATIKLYEGMNHWYQYAASSSEDEYPKAGQAFADPVLPDLIAWIKGVLASMPNRTAQPEATAPPGGAAPATTQEPAAGEATAAPAPPGGTPASGG